MSFNKKAWIGKGKQNATPLSANNLNDLENRISQGFNAVVSAKKLTWGTSLSFGMTVGQQALILVNSSVLIIVWRSGGGYTHSVVSTNTIDYTVETNESNVTINFKTQVTATAFLF